MTTRITGTNSGIDVDSVVKESLLTEQNKIDKAYQQQMVYTYQQEQLKDIVNSADDFYDKYLDILSSGNLLTTNKYETLKFTSTDASGNASTAVTAKGYAGADVGNYSVSVSQIAKKASALLKENSFKNAINSGNGVIAVTMKNTSGEDVSAYADIVFTNGEINLNSTADALNAELKKKGINATAKYSEFSKGIVIESGSSGEEVEFGTAIKEDLSTADSKTTDFAELFKDKYAYYSGQNAKGTITKGSGEDAVVYQVNKSSNVISIDNVQFTFNSTTTGSKIENADSSVHGTYTGGNVGDGTTVTLEGKDGKTTVIKNNYVLTNQTYTDGITFKSITNKISADNIDASTLDVELDGESTKAIVRNGIKIQTTLNEDGSKSTKVTCNGRTVDFSGVEAVVNSNGTVSKTKDGMTLTLNNGTLEVNDQTVSGNLGALTNDTTGATISTDNAGNTTVKKDGKTTVIEKSADGNTTTYTTTKTYDNGMTVKTVSVETKSIDPETNKTVTNTTVNSKIVGGSLSDLTVDYNENPNLKMTIDEETEDASSDYISKKTSITRTIDSDGNPVQNTTTIVGKSDGTSQTITTEQSINSNGTLGTSKTTGTSSDKINLTGQTDITSLKDTIVKFVDDYNTLIKSINEKLWEKRDKDYMPLTDEQKKSMTDSQIEAWEKKAKTGLLRSDSDLRRIQSSMRSAMSSLMSGTGLTLKDIGIKPVDNFTTKNGMYEVDESKLTSALENNAAGVKDLLTRTASGNDKGGVLVQLQSVMKSEFKSSDSALSKRIGFEGTSTESDNTLSNYIKTQKNLITNLKKKYNTKETALYNKYSNLEVTLSNLNSQYSSLTSLLGQ